ncbi:hypothetical protein TNCV_2581321 [Trichonephila clavipes]|nr:hypothetical protein TNCV_2581321 [Trichonephila clavipes]
MAVLSTPIPREHYIFINIHLFYRIRTQVLRRNSQRCEPLYRMGDGYFWCGYQASPIDNGCRFSFHPNGKSGGDACPSLKRHLKLHEVSRAKILENKRKRLNSSPQPGPSGYQTPAAKDRRDNTKSRTCLNTFETYTISTDLNFIKNLNGFLQNSKEEVVRIVENKSKEKKGIKWYVCAKVRFVRKQQKPKKKNVNRIFDQFVK